MRALERFARWADAEDPGRGVAAFRRAFAAIWLVYDVLDLALGATERSRGWFPHARDPGLVVVQIVLVAAGAMLVWGRGVWVFGMTAAAARAAEAFVYFPLNDFFLGSVLLLLLAHSTGGPFRGDRRPLWVRDALLAQLSAVYFATAVLKMNPDWLGGGHLFVRTQYLKVAWGWPYPAWLEGALANRAFDALLAKAAIAAQLALGCVLLARRPYWLGAALVIAIHAFGALVTNVWFLSATMIAGVVLVLPRRRAAGLHPKTVHGMVEAKFGDTLHAKQRQSIAHGVVGALRTDRAAWLAPDGRRHVVEAESTSTASSRSRSRQVGYVERS